MRVHVAASLLLRNRTQKQLQSDRRPVRPINAADLETRERLHSLLRTMTRPVDAGDVVEAVIVDADLDALYDILNVVGRPPDPIPIDLPDDS